MSGCEAVPWRAKTVHEAPNSSVTRMRSAIWSFVIDGIPTNAKDFEECTSYLTHPSPTQEMLLPIEHTVYMTAVLPFLC